MRRVEAISGESVGSVGLWMGQTHVAPAPVRPITTTVRPRPGSSCSAGIRSSSSSKTAPNGGFARRRGLRLRTAVGAAPRGEPRPAGRGGGRDRPATPRTRSWSIWTTSSGRDRPRERGTRPVRAALDRHGRDRDRNDRAHPCLCRRPALPGRSCRRSGYPCPAEHRVDSVHQHGSTAAVALQVSDEPVSPRPDRARKAHGPGFLRRPERSPRPGAGSRRGHSTLAPVDATAVSAVPSASRGRAPPVELNA